jgi:hypothetical protein
MLNRREYVTPFSTWRCCPALLATAPHRILADEKAAIPFRRSGLGGCRQSDIESVYI